MSLLEILATLFAFIYIALTIGEHRISWPISILSALLYIFVFWLASLYYQSILQVFFILSSFYGWWIWNPRRENEIKIGTLSLWQNIIWIISSLIITIPATVILGYYTDSPAPILDAITSVFSIAATFLTAHKKIESWWYWIAIDLLSIWLFASQGLYLTSIVYAGFLILAVLGLRAWRFSAAQILDK